MNNSASTTKYHEIYLSPHLDDVVFSCGGRIANQARQGRQILIVTVAAGNPPPGELTPLAKMAHQYWNLADNPIESRIAEDINACTVLGVNYLHWSMPDCIYLKDQVRGTALYKTSRETLGPIHPGDKRLTDIKKLMSNLPPAGLVFTPLALGNHVDHQITRASSESIFPDNLVFYEEFPYTLIFSGQDKMNKEGEAWSSEVYRHTNEDLQKKILAAGKYTSQIKGIFGSSRNLRVKYYSHFKALDGERYWTVKRVAKPTT